MSVLIYYDKLMRLESTSKPDQYKVWMTDSELETIRRHAASQRDDIIIQLGGYVGLRAFEIPQPTPKNKKRTEDGDHYRLHIREGKDTDEGVGKPRDAYLPPETEADLHRYINAEDIGRNDPIIDIGERAVRDVVKRTVERTAEETGSDDYRHVSSHDLRRRYAQRLLVDENMNPRVVMQVGGWGSFQAIEPYLKAPTPDIVNEAFEDADF